MRDQYRIERKGKWGTWLTADTLFDCDSNPRFAERTLGNWREAEARDSLLPAEYRLVRRQVSDWEVVA